MAEQIKFVGELSRLDVKPGDRFVIHCDGHLPMETVEHLERAWRDFIGSDETKVLVLPKGFRLGVIGEPPPGKASEEKAA